MWNGYQSIKQTTHISICDLLSSFQRPIRSESIDSLRLSSLRAAERLVLLLFVFRSVNRLRFFIFDAGPVSEDPRLIGFWPFSRASLDFSAEGGSFYSLLSVLSTVSKFFSKRPGFGRPPIDWLFSLSFGPRRPASSRDAAYRGSGFCRQLGSKKNST